MNLSQRRYDRHACLDNLDKHHIVCKGGLFNFSKEPGRHGSTENSIRDGQILKFGIELAYLIDFKIFKLFKAFWLFAIGA